MERRCDDCGLAYVARHPSSKFCTPRCRNRAHRRPKDTAAPRLEAVAALPEDTVARTDGTIAAAVRREVAALELTAHTEAQVALVLARRMDSDAETGAAVASLARQFAVVMVDLRRLGAAAKADALDAIAERARLKLVGAPHDR